VIKLNEVKKKNSNHWKLNAAGGSVQINQNNTDHIMS